MLQMGVTGTPGDVAARLAELRRPRDTVPSHLYDVVDLADVGPPGREACPGWTNLGWPDAGR